MLGDKRESLLFVAEVIKVPLQILKGESGEVFRRRIGLLFLGWKIGRPEARDVFFAEVYTSVSPYVHLSAADVKKGLRKHMDAYPELWGMAALYEVCSEDAEPALEEALRQANFQDRSRLMVSTAA